MGEIYRMESHEPDGTGPTIVVRDTMAGDVQILGRNLRKRDILMAEKVGIAPHRALWRIFKRSLMCKTVLLDDRIVAMWGLAGTWMGKVGKPWFIASPEVDDYPFKLAFRYRSELRKMRKYFPILEDYVNVDDKKTIRLLEILGFRFEEPRAIGENNTMFMRATISEGDVA